MAKPRPRDAPVTRATRPLSEKRSVMSGVSGNEEQAGRFPACLEE
jgi:hypothetical protein